MVDLLVRHDNATIGEGAATSDGAAAENGAATGEGALTEGAAIALPHPAPAPGPRTAPDPGTAPPQPDPPGFEWPAMTRRFQPVLRGHPYRQDVALALAVFLLTLLPTQVGAPSMLLHARALLVVTSIVQSVTIIWRRPAPLVTYGIVLAACTVEWANTLSSTSDIALLVCLYTVARYCSLMTLRVALGTLVPSLIVLMVQMTPVQGPALLSLFFLGTAVAASAAFGLIAREKQAQLATLAERAIQAEQQREQRARLAVLAERARFSRETHDIVGHSLAVIIGLSDGGARQVEAHPERGRQVLELIAETSRQSLADLRQTLGALREDRFEEAFAPQPGIADICGLLERTRSAGPRVSCRAAGRTEALPRSLQSATYRIVQEALTNSLKHAGPDTSVQVVIEADERWLQLSVADTGPAGTRRSLPAPPDTRGQGLAGMRERATLAGGRAEAGPNDAGGWTVAARFPLAPAGPGELR